MKILLGILSTIVSLNICSGQATDEADYHVDRFGNQRMYVKFMDGSVHYVKEVIYEQFGVKPKSWESLNCRILDKGFKVVGKTEEGCLGVQGHMVYNQQAVPNPDGGPGFVNTTTIQYVYDGDPTILVTGIHENIGYAYTNPILMQYMGDYRYEYSSGRTKILAKYDFGDKATKDDYTAYSTRDKTSLASQLFPTNEMADLIKAQQRDKAEKSFKTVPDEKEQAKVSPDSHASNEIKSKEFDYEGIRLGATTETLNAKYPYLKYDKESSDPKTGLAIYYITETKTADIAIFYVFSEKVYRMKIIYESEKLNKIGGSTTIHDKLVARFGNEDVGYPPASFYNDFICCYIWKSYSAGKSISFIVDKKGAGILENLDKDADNQLTEKKKHQADVGF